jgi:uncharacterized protein YllA (UPF0747 family)
MCANRKVNIAGTKDNKLLGKSRGKGKYLLIMEELESDNTWDQTLDDNIYKKVKEQSDYLEKMELKINKQLRHIEDRQDQNVRKIHKEITRNNEEIKRTNEEMKRNNEVMKMQLDQMEMKSNKRLGKLESLMSSLDKFIREKNK